MTFIFYFLFTWRLHRYEEKGGGQFGFAISWPTRTSNPERDLSDVPHEDRIKYSYRRTRWTILLTVGILGRYVTLLRSIEETDSRDMIMKFSPRFRLIVYKNSKFIVLFPLLFEGSTHPRGRWKKHETKNKSGEIIM